MRGRGLVGMVLLGSCCYTDRMRLVQCGHASPTPHTRTNPNRLPNRLTAGEGAAALGLDGSATGLTIQRSRHGTGEVGTITSLAVHGRLLPNRLAAAAEAHAGPSAAPTLPSAAPPMLQSKVKGRAREFCALLRLQPSVVEQALHLLSQAIPHLLGSWRRDHLAAAATYAACRWAGLRGVAVQALAAPACPAGLALPPPSTLPPTT